MTIRPAILHHYRRFRAHQMSVYPSCVTTDPSGRSELTAASAPYGEHALSAYIGAKRHLHFVADLGATLKASERRSAAAKRGWKKRRAA